MTQTLYDLKENQFASEKLATNSTGSFNMGRARTHVEKARPSSLAFRKSITQKNEHSSSVVDPNKKDSVYELVSSYSNLTDDTRKRISF